ncbi:MAG TPA: NAD(P)/FAD-dependent oxidoreductase [Vicinamibacterales bacterium]|nr:NAD(P)/FAD-dependent oxidoreductase [Vicinamibacterales bacterium]
MTRTVDVVIAGARCAGAATAMLLARAGARVIVVDKGVYGTDTLSTHALMRGAVLQLHRWGVLPAIIAAGTPAVRSTRFAYSSQDVSIAIEPRDGVDALYAPRRVLLDRVLVDAATDSGAEFLFQSKATDLLHDADGRVSGLRLDTPHGPLAIRANFVIGADGLHSTMARRVGAADVLTGHYATAVLYSYWQGLSNAGYEWHYTSRASVGAIPTNEGAHCVFVSFPAEHLSATPGTTATEKYERLLREFPSLAPLLADARRVEPVRGFGGQRGFLKRSTGPGWALAGDAGYFKDPLTAHGITDALRDAELLARAVIRGTDEALAEYETIRHDLSHRLFEVTDRIASFVWTEPELQSLHRAFSAEMSREVRALTTLEPLSCLSAPASALPVA